MRTFTALVLLCLFAVAITVTAQSQTRPRRVNPASPQQGQPNQSRTAPQQTDDPSQPPRPGRAPVLGGANRNPNEQKPTAPQKDAGPEEVGEGDVVKIDTTLVSIPVSVMDRDGKFIPNLSQNDFHVWEDGVEQRVAYFASTEKPFTVVLMIDTSGSTRFRLEEIQDAAIAFVEQLRADDRVMVVAFSDKIRFLSQPTNDRNRLREAIRRTEPGSGTRLYDAVDEVINQHLNQIQGRKAIVLFTDGVDTTSRQGTYESNVRDAEELDALIYPVEYDTFTDMGILNPGGSWPGGGGSSGNVIIDILGGILGGGGGGYPGGGGGYPNPRGGRRGGGGWPGTGTSRAEYELGDQYLHELARVSGARLYNAEQQNLSVAFQSVAEELRRQYSLGYYPTNTPHPGERRNIKVRVNRPELVVRTRDSYVFQPGANAAAQRNNPQPSAPVLKKNFNRGFVR
ncbi:MAG TPA: VWA domain-containing protein [Pyrinomonadaceae bacterium]|nr:VWA domain-containing protein [Pyrinomonadaceae bacterium]